jgi:hypothetical protein
MFFMHLSMYGLAGGTARSNTMFHLLDCLHKCMLVMNPGGSKHAKDVKSRIKALI